MIHKWSLLKIGNYENPHKLKLTHTELQLRDGDVMWKWRSMKTVEPEGSEDALPECVTTNACSYALAAPHTATATLSDPFLKYIRCTFSFANMTNVVSLCCSSTLSSPRLLSEQKNKDGTTDLAADMKLQIDTEQVSVFCRHSANEILHCFFVSPTSVCLLKGGWGCSLAPRMCHQHSEWHQIILHGLKKEGETHRGEIERERRRGLENILKSVFLLNWIVIYSIRSRTSPQSFIRTSV